MGGIFSSLLGTIVSPIAGYLKDRQDVKAQVQANKLAYLKAVGDRNAQMASQGQQITADWEMQSMKYGAAYRGFELFILSIPVILCFTPWAYIVSNGFRALDHTPGWFQVAFLTVFFANYGIRLRRIGVLGFGKKGS